MRTTVSEALRLLPGAATSQYPEGAPSAVALAHGNMRLLMFTPGSNADGRDRQQPHAQDELYLVQRGQARFAIDGADEVDAAPGDVLFVPAGRAHRFTSFSPDFATWVVFYGPSGGETP